MSNISEALSFIRKVAYVPLTPAAQQAAQGAGAPPPPPADPNAVPPQDPAMAGGQGGPAMPPMPPEQGEMPPQGGAQLPPEILQDQQFIQALQQMAGIMFDPNTATFMSPDGQPVPPEMIMQAYQDYMSSMQGGQMPPQAGAAPMPMDPAMAGGQPPMDPAMAQQAAPPMQQMAAEDPAMAGVPKQMPVDPAMMGGAPVPAEAAPGLDPAVVGVSMDPATGMPINPATGTPVDPATGMPVDPNTGASSPSAGMPGEQAAQELFAAIPGLQEFIAKAPKQLEAHDKTMTRLQQDINGTRNDLQGLRREIQKNNDNQDTMLGRMDNLLQIVEGLIMKGHETALTAATSVPQNE